MSKNTVQCKEILVLIFHRCFTYILNYALHCVVLGLEEMSRNLMEKGNFLPGHYSFFLKKKNLTA